MESMLDQQVDGMSEEALAKRMAAGINRYLPFVQGAFRRSDQFRWAAVYIRALCAASGRKNVENLARAAVLSKELECDDVAQALGHFLNHSPWDEKILERLYLKRIAQQLGIEQGVFVLEEVALTKQGRHSVGVHRQFSRALGCKTNCQLAVILHHIGPGGAYPLALRLYLPRAWLADDERLTAAGVPSDSRVSMSKLELGLALLDAARGAGLTAQGLVGGVGWASEEETAEITSEQGMTYYRAVPLAHAERLQASNRRLFGQLGLDHFEGRSWRGFHHHSCLVMLAAGFMEGLG